jgi:nucleoside-diphosphate-sugar epimerase
MTFLITGGSGFVGLNVLHRLLARGDSVVNFSLAEPPPAAGESLAALPGTLRTVTGDLRDPRALEAAFADGGITHVLHAGVITAGAQREAEDAAGIVAVNVAGTVNVMEAARRHGVRRVVYPGSGAVYGANGFSAPLLDEARVAPNPESLYGITKLAAERIALRYRAIAGLDVVAARLGGVFGPWEYATGQRDTLSPILAATRLALADGEAVLEGAGRRDWIYAPDVAEALLFLLEWPSAPRHAVYHVAAGRSWSVAEWCTALQARRPKFRWRLAARPEEANVPVHWASARAPLSPARLRDEMGWSARFGMDAALADFLEGSQRHLL